MKFEALSTIPYVFESYFSGGQLGNALEKGFFEFEAHNLHDWGLGLRQNTDDRPFGGGAGQVMLAEPIFTAVRELSAQNPKPYVIFFSPTGMPFTQQVAERLSTKERILFVCGRFEGIDERAYTLADECLSLGDYVLTGGELPALVVTDAVARLLPGVLGNPESALDESFSLDGLLEYAQYTQPANFEGMEVPEILRSGNHAAIAKWRRQNALERTCKLRPDLIEAANLTPEEREYATKVLGSVNVSSKGEQS